jgi:hypothetical protein
MVTILTQDFSQDGSHLPLLSDKLQHYFGDCFITFLRPIHIVLAP